MDMADQDIPSTPGGAPQGQPVPPPPHDPSHEGHIESDLPHLRTYADDLSDEMKRKGSTLASIVGAERERAARELALDQVDESEETVSKWKNPVLLVSTIVLSLAAVVAIGVTIYFTQFANTSEPTDTPSIIFPNKIVKYTVPSYLSVSDALAGERISQPLSLGEIERVDLTLEVGTTSARDLLAKFNPPPELLREAESVMFGVHSFDHNQPFIIIEVTQYDRAYGAMLKWEEDMGRNLGNFYKPEGGKVPPTTLFTDKVIQNIDVRISQPEWPILYAFPRRDVLVITTNQYTLQEILTRLNAQMSNSGQ